MGVSAAKVVPPWTESVGIIAAGPPPVTLMEDTRHASQQCHGRRHSNPSAVTVGALSTTLLLSSSTFATSIGNRIWANPRAHILTGRILRCRILAS